MHRRFRPSRPALPVRLLLESLEKRLCMTAQPNFADFSSISGLALNGSATQSGNSLLLQTADHQSGSAWWNQKLDVTNFTTHFTLQPTAIAGVDDYYTFAIQNGSTSALGADDINSGYANGTVPSQAIALSFTTENLGSGSGFQFLTGNGAPVFNNFVQMPGVNMSTTDTFGVTANYDGTTLSVTVTDLNHTADTFSTSEAINLPTVLGGNSAFAGFTVGSGSDNTFTSFKSWTYTQNNVTTPTPSPTFTTGATGSVAANGTSFNLTSLATITDGSTLSYSWIDLTRPSGANVPTFSSATSNSTTAFLSKAGTYHFQVTATSSNGTSTASIVSVRVEQNPTRLLVEPHGVSIQHGKHYTFSASVVDQFSHALSTQPTIKFYVVRGGGVINYKTGLYTAGATAGSLEIEAKGDGFAGKALESIV